MDGNKEILKAEVEDGYGRVANLLLEALSLSQLNGKQMSICLFIMRRTYSWGKKSDEITLKEFALACNSSETYMSKQLKQLIDLRVIKRNNYSPGKTPEYEINTRVDEWDKGCLNRQGLIENIVNNLYVESTLEQKDGGCTKGQGLNEKTRQPLNKRTRVAMAPAIEIPTKIEPPKESSKESITTTISIESEEEENVNGNSVADIGADPIQQNENKKRESDLQKIENYYLTEVRKKTMCSGNDTMAIIKAYETYKDIDFILGVLESGTKENIARNNGRCSINSFSYFTSIFEERWNALHAKKKEVEVKAKEPSKKYYSGNKVQARKTRFHNFEQRTSKYTADQLEEIVRKKREEYYRKAQEQKEQEKEA